MPQSLASVYLHVVFSTKNRVPAITPDLRPRLYPYLAGIALGSGTKLLDAGGVADHVHLLVSLGRELTIADLVKTLKAGSSRWVHDTFPGRRDFAWQAGYGAFSVGFPELGAVRAYIAGQEEHHRAASFQDEFRALLTRHGVAWDERYVWD
ncbi:MAG: IS200/IS605 family transposase [Gemmataceae bacterium]|nr:IS200/IS605 family transposase [Gemmataceae bacterium]